MLPLKSPCNNPKVVEPEQLPESRPVVPTLLSFVIFLQTVLFCQGLLLCIKMFLSSNQKLCCQVPP